MKLCPNCSESLCNFLCGKHPEPELMHDLKQADRMDLKTATRPVESAWDCAPIHPVQVCCSVAKGAQLIGHSSCILSVHCANTS